MYIKRDIAKSIIAGSKQVPVIAIIGPRQSGKSTLAREIFKNHKYLDMQDAQLLDFANSDPKGFLESFKNNHGIIIDEAQYAPKLFSQIKVEADKNPQTGYYILSGSQNFLLHEKISESLAGRVYFYKLLPLSINELKSANLLINNPSNQMFKGFYPKVYYPNVDFQEYYDNYISTYVERDFRLIRNIENILTFQKFVKLCALRIGTTLNISDISTNCGISQNTAKSWLSLLEASFILFLLPPYYENLGKRVTKSPKIYFYDTGLALSIIEINYENLIKKRELYGSIFENMVIVDLIKNINAQNLKSTLSFYRDSNNNEIDLIVESQGKTIPIEIKASQTMQSHFFDNLEWFTNTQKTESKPIVVYGGNQKQIRSLGITCPWEDVFNIIKDLK